MDKILFTIFLSIGLFSSTINVVPVSKKNINWKHKITRDDVILVEVNKKYSCKG